MTLTLTWPLARTEAQRVVLAANDDISPMNCPSLLIATKYSFLPLPNSVVNSRALLAPCRVRKSQRLKVQLLTPTTGISVISHKHLNYQIRGPLGI